MNQMDHAKSKFAYVNISMIKVNFSIISIVKFIRASKLHTCAMASLSPHPELVTLTYKSTNQHGIAPMELNTIFSHPFIACNYTMYEHKWLHNCFRSWFQSPSFFSEGVSQISWTFHIHHCGKDGEHLICHDIICIETVAESNTKLQLNSTPSLSLICSSFTWAHASRFSDIETLISSTFHHISCNNLRRKI